jgi:ribosomal protein S18 acetylase RimI-like enzyme
MSLTGERTDAVEPAWAVRDARRVDVPTLVLLWKEMMDFHSAFDERFRFLPNAGRSVEQHLMATLRSRGARIVVAEASGRVIGYVLGEIHQRRPIYPVGTYGFISDISVTADWRRCGVGRALADALLRWFRACGVTAVELFAAERNPVAVEFWRSAGFAEYLRLLRIELDDREAG